MQEVAHHLQKQAHLMSGSERDAFARSAYNRYYYSCFLSVRSIFSEMTPSWGQAKHKSFPELLRGSIKKTFKAERVRACRLGDTDLIKQLDQALRAIEALAPIIERANGTRIVADYHPEITVGFTDSSRFSLNGVEITDAHQWNEKVTTLTKQILSTWRQIHA